MEPGKPLAIHVITWTRERSTPKLVNFDESAGLIYDDKKVNFLAITEDLLGRSVETQSIGWRFSIEIGRP